PAQRFTPAEPDRQCVAGIMGSPSHSPVHLPVPVLEAKHRPLPELLDDPRVIQHSEVPTATIHLVGMDRSAHDALLSLLRQIGVDGLPEKAPTKSTDAALALIGPVREADVDLSELDRLSELLER